MKKFWVMMLVVLVAGLIFVGCGDDDDAADNVGACEDWVAAMECGDFDITQYIDCAIYEETACDISDYFDCLTDNTTCDEATGMLDMTGWGECVSKAQCD